MEPHAHRKGSCSAVQTKAHLNTLFQESRNPEYCEPQMLPQESSESNPAQDKFPVWLRFPFIPRSVLLFPSVFISVYLCSSVDSILPPGAPPKPNYRCK